MCDLSVEDHHAAMIVAREFHFDLIRLVDMMFRAADELGLAHSVVSIAITVESLRLAAVSHEGSDASFMLMAREAYASARTGNGVQ